MNIVQSFRTQTLDDSTVQEATQFFAKVERAAPPLYPKPDPFYLNALKINLPKVDYPMKSLPGPSLAMNSSSWSNEFLKQDSLHVREVKTGMNSEAHLRQLPNAQFSLPLGTYHNLSLLCILSCV